MAGINIVGVQFRRAGKIYHFDGKELSLAIGDQVVVDTERGHSLAQVKSIKYERETEFDRSNLKPILRVASKKDLKSSQRLTVDSATSFTKERIKELDLNMHVINVEIQFGGNKVLIYFSAPGRVDFRELVKELASGLKTRVELKQVGARDEAKLAGGIGICGREFCCSSFLREFVPVSIRMAKNQNLALNPSKVSGGCGRLLCCLTYEDDTYRDLKQKLLPKGTKVRLADGEIADVVKGDILNQVMLVENSSGELVNVPVSALTPLSSSEMSSDSDADQWADDIDFDELMDENAGTAEQVAARSEELNGGKSQSPAKQSSSMKSVKTANNNLTQQSHSEDEDKGGRRPARSGQRRSESRNFRAKKNRRPSRNNQEPSSQASANKPNRDFAKPADASNNASGNAKDSVDYESRSKRPRRKGEKPHFKGKKPFSKDKPSNQGQSDRRSRPGNDKSKPDDS